MQLYCFWLPCSCNFVTRQWNRSSAVAERPRDVSTHWIFRCHSRSFKIIETGTIRKLWHGFLFTFRSNYGFCSIFEINDILVENRDFFHTPLHSTTPLWGPRWNISIPFGVEKLESRGNPVVKNVWGYVYCVAIPTEYRCVCQDGQTDRRADILRRHSIAR